MALTIINDTALHEAAHCIMSYLFNDLFHVNFVTANSYLSRQQDASSLGGLSASLSKKVGTLKLEDHDAMVLICLAGLAADDINHCNNIITDQLYDNALFANNMRSKKYSGDFNLLYPHLRRVIWISCVEQRSYTRGCQQLLHEIFSNVIVLPVLIGLRNEIDSKPNKTLTGKEIIDYLDKSQLNDWRENEWKNIYSQRINSIKNEKHFIKKFFFRLRWVLS